MREATPGIDRILEFCKVVLDAETEEEIEEIMDQIPEILKEEGYGEGAIEGFMKDLDKVLELLQNEEIALDEEGNLTKGPNFEEEDTLEDIPETIPVMESETQQPVENSFASYAPTVGLGLAASVLVGCIALRKTKLKNKKNKGL